MNALERIVAAVRVDLEQRRGVVPQRELSERARVRAQGSDRRDFAAALRRPGLSVIAEHKRRSPSAGAIREDLGLEEVVRAYERGGAAAVSVLTEPDSFGGSLEDLGRARAASTLPILRKDFIVDEYQLVEAAAAGADAVLLIVAALGIDVLARLHAQARELGLSALVEVHDISELKTAVVVGAEIIGVNNRDLTSLEVDTRRTFELLELIPDDRTVVAESGFRTPEQLAELRAAGVDAVLIGEALMRAGDLEVELRRLLGDGAGAP